MSSMAKNAVKKSEKNELTDPALRTGEIFRHSKRVTSNPKAKNWLEESWKSLEHFNSSHLGRLHATKTDTYVLYCANYLMKYERCVIGSNAHESLELSSVIRICSESHTEEFEISDELQLDTIRESQSIEVDCKKFSVQKPGNTCNEEFEIPSLPSGRKLVINIHTTWGDKYYVGLNGIELFSDKGDLVSVAKIEADPSDLTVLPGCKNDPRVVDNLLNGINHTCDDVNMWLAPFTEGGSHFIYVTFSEATRLAMMRLWNYNKSRIHSDRGARAVTMTLDDVPIFCGEINKASGSVATGSNFGDNILFTTDDAILEKISEHDNMFDVDFSSDSEDECIRPSTSNNDIGQGSNLSVTSVKDDVADDSNQDISGTFCAKCLQINILSTWGDSQFVGMTGLQVLGEFNEPVPLSSHLIRDCTSNTSNDDINRLIDDTNITTSEDHMWSVPFSTASSSPYSIEINFVQAVQISGLRVWNYNQSFEDTYRGVKDIEIKLDDRALSAQSNIFILRRAPGNLHFDFAQDVIFETKSSTLVQAPGSPQPKNTSTNSSLNLHYDIPYMPTGFVYKIELFDTWGDLYYIGLNGIEFYDASGRPIQLTEKEIAAFPSSVNILDQTTDDIRTPDKLIDGVNNTREGQYMWLAPILPGQINFVYVVFDTPQTVSMIKLWNYAKTAARGARNFAVLVDDLLVYSGMLQPVSSDESLPVDGQSIIFSEDENLIMNNSVASEAKEQDVRWNDHDRVIESRSRVNQELRPTTSLVTMKNRVKAKF